MYLTFLLYGDRILNFMMLKPAGYCQGYFFGLSIDSIVVLTDIIVKIFFYAHSINFLSKKFFYIYSSVESTDYFWELF